MASPGKKRGDASGLVLKRMNMLFNPADPADAAFLELYNTCTDGVKLHLCKELLISALPSSVEAADMLLARAMRRASNTRRGRPTVREPMAPAGVLAPPAAPVVAALPPAPAPSPLQAPVAPSASQGGSPALKDFASLLGAGAGWETPSSSAANPA